MGYVTSKGVFYVFVCARNLFSHPNAVGQHAARATATTASSPPAPALLLLLLLPPLPASPFTPKSPPARIVVPKAGRCCRMLPTDRRHPLHACSRPPTTPCPADASLSPSPTLPRAASLIPALSVWAAASPACPKSVAERGTYFRVREACSTPSPALAPSSVPLPPSRFP